MQPLISLIIPVYNVQAYLEECVRSVVCQSYENLEILLVDDGSTDNSGQLCDLLCKQDSRINVYHKKNGGLSDARNYGIDRAKGEWLVFVDSDDLISPDMVKRLYEIVIDEKSDIAIVDPVHFENIDNCIFYDSGTICNFSPEEAICEMLYQKSFLMSACGKIFDKNLFKQVRFPVGMLYEDVAIMYLLFDNASKISYGNMKMYGYRHRNNSITNTDFKENDIDILTISEELAGYFSKRSEKLQSAVKAYCLTAHFRIYMNAPRTERYRTVRNNCKKYLERNSLNGLIDANTRKKMKIAILGFWLCRPVLLYVYRKIDRWK